MFFRLLNCKTDDEKQVVISAIANWSGLLFFGTWVSFGLWWRQKINAEYPSVNYSKDNPYNPMMQKRDYL